jgi:hypothetical protein
VGLLFAAIVGGGVGVGVGAEETTAEELIIRKCCGCIYVPLVYYFSPITSLQDKSYGKYNRATAYNEKGPDLKFVNAIQIFLFVPFRLSLVEGEKVETRKSRYAKAYFRAQNQMATL